MDDSLIQVSKSPLSVPFNNEPGDYPTTAIPCPIENLFQSKRFCTFLRYEWLYSQLDKEIFLNCNDLQTILREQFRNLKSRNLTRGHWNCIRRIIGRPRRFSYSFLEEERKSINRKRQTMRSIQHFIKNAHVPECSFEQVDETLCELPDNCFVPLRQQPGSDAIVLLTKPVKGLYLCEIHSSSNLTSHYNISLKKILLSNSQICNDDIKNSNANLNGNCVIIDEDLFPCSVESTSIVTIKEAKSFLKSTYSKKVQGNQSYEYYYDENSVPVGYPLEHPNESLLDSNKCENIFNIQDLSNTNRTNELTDQKDLMTNFFVSLGRTYRLLHEKRKSVATLAELNDAAETNQDSEDFISVEFQHKYATLILRLDEINRALKRYIDIILKYITEPQDEPMANTVSVHSATESAYPFIFRTPISAMPDYMSTVQGQDLSMSVSLDSTLVPHLYESCGIQDLNGTPNSSINAEYDLAGKFGMSNVAYLADWRRTCEDEAFDLVNRLKTSQGRTVVDESKSVLVAKLTSILTLLAHLQDNRMTNDELSCIEEVFSDIRQRLYPTNLKCFEQSVEQLISQIVLNLSPSILPISQTYSSQQRNSNL